MQSDSAYILEVKLVEFTDGLDEALRELGGEKTHFI